MCQARKINSHQNFAKETLYSILSSLATETFFPSWQIIKVNHKSKGFASDKSLVAALTSTKCGSGFFNVKSQEMQHNPTSQNVGRIL